MKVRFVVFILVQIPKLMPLDGNNHGWRECGVGHTTMLIFFLEYKSIYVV